MNVIKFIRCNVKILNQTKKCFSTSTSDPAKTALYDLHVENGGKMVDFAGYYLPVQYGKESITNSHLHTRENCSIFDVSHMLQTRIHGDDRIEFVERLTTADVRSLQQGKACLTVFTDKNTGGILDDLIITNTSDGYLYVVSNAGRREHDTKLFLDAQEEMKGMKKNVEVEFLDLNDYSLIAVQGPKTKNILQPIVNIQLDKLVFMTSAIATVGGIQGCRISRCGYTGEDGVEISVPSKSVTGLVQNILYSNKDAKLAGLGVRDSLRLEAGLCLYGSDIDESVTPVEASLAWLIPKTRRERGDYPGSSVIQKQLKEGVLKKRIGLKLEKGPPARHDCLIQSESGETIGKVTSGCPSPSLGGSVAMGYVQKSFTKIGTQVQVQVRGKSHPATISKMPFLPSKYYAG